MNDDFITRIELLLTHLSLTTSAFADRIGVQRSGISHLLSGRNKPSLDFILKITDAFPEIDIYWLLKGDGNMIKDEASTPSMKKPETEIAVKPIVKKNTSDNKEIEKIIIFYKDGSFSEHHPEGK